jgi:Protein of unknown function with PCYCGC motif
MGMAVTIAGNRSGEMRLISKLLGGIFLLASAGLILVSLPERGDSSTLAAVMSKVSRGQAGAEEVPAYHEQAPKEALPSTMNPLAFTDIVVQNAYTLAGRIKKTLYQQPCYCHCDRSQGHGSLLDCFASRHGSGCNICMSEAFYSYEQVQKKKTAAQIRAGIEQGEWKKVDLNQYSTPLPVK